MNKGVVLGVIVAIAAFAGGAWYGRASKSAVVITSGSGGASYTGGVQGGADGAGATAQAVSRYVAGITGRI